MIAATPAQHRLGDAQCEQDRQEHEAGGDQGVVEDGHLDEQAAGLVWMAGRHLQRRVGAERGTADHGLVELEMVDERGHLIAERGHAVGAHVGRLVRDAVAEEIDRDHAKAARSHCRREVVVHVAVHQQAVGEHQRARPLAVLGIGDAMSVEAKAAFEGPHRRASVALGSPVKTIRRGRAPTVAKPATPPAPRASRARG